MFCIVFGFDFGDLVIDGVHFLGKFKVMRWLSDKIFGEDVFNNYCVPKPFPYFTHR